MKAPGGQGLANVPVHFTAPASRPSGQTFDQITDSSGIAAGIIVPNTVPGPYAVTATANGLTATFNRINQFNLTLVSVSPTVSNVTTIVLQVNQNYGPGVAGVTLNLAAPASGATGMAQGLKTDFFGKATVTFSGNNTGGSYNLAFSFPYSTPSTILVPITNSHYIFDLSTPATSTLLLEYFPKMGIFVSGAAAGQLNFSTPFSGPTGTIDGGFSGAASPNQVQGYSVPPIKANATAGTWQLRATLNPNIYQDFALTNVKGNITPVVTVIPPSKYAYGVYIHTASF